MRFTKLKRRLVPTAPHPIFPSVAATPESSDAGKLKQLGRYAIVREIGRGGMGVVYLATDPFIGRSVAIKAIAAPSGLDECQRTQRFERFAREAKAAGILSHPGIVTVYDAGRDETSGLCYITMEYVAGRTLKQEIAESGAMPEEKALALVLTVAEALDHAHRRGIVHRDLKPANLLLGENGSIKITDFGVARMESSELTREGQPIGSPAYMSPEQALGRAADGRSDLFSLGVVLYEMLTGKKPFTGTDTSAVLYQIVHEKQAASSLVNRRLSPAWDQIVARLMSKRPEERYPDARALRVDLEALAPGQRQAGPRPADEHADATVLDRRTASATPAGSTTRLIPLLSREIAGAWEVARHRAITLLPHVRSLLYRFLILPGRRKAAVVTAGLVAAILVSMALGVGGTGRCPVNVELRHGLEAGSLQIDLDGRNVVNRRFRGESQATRVLGKDFFKRTGGTVEDSFVVPPGVHQISVRVRADDGVRDWSQTVRRNFEKGERAVLQVRAATAFSKGLRLDWRVAERDAEE